MKENYVLLKHILVFMTAYYVKEQELAQDQDH